MGLSDTECSILKFFDQFLDGETKQEKPRWPGITGINGILEDLTYEINLMKTDIFLASHKLILFNENKD